MEIQLKKHELLNFIKQAITGDGFNYNVAFVLENILATENALENSIMVNANDTTDINSWNLTSIDWSKNTEDDLTENYQDQILAGLNGNPVVSEVQGQYDHIFADSAGISGCAETKLQGFNKWDCPDEISAQNPSDPPCTLEQVIEEVCIQVR